MSGNDWFPFYFDRLRKSKWWRRASDVARARNVMMWGEAFKAVPAGSLPDDDDELAEAAGFGMDVDAFLAAKAEIMAPWTLCADGRWYHPTVCEVVLDAWERASDRRKAAAERQRRRREKVRGEPGNVARVTPKSDHVTHETPTVTRDIADLQRDFGIQDSTDSTVEEADASLSSADDERPAKYPEPFEAIWKAYPHVKGRSSKPKSLGYWRRIPMATRNRLPSAVDRYARDGREPKQDCGAPGMERWLRDERYLDWLEDEPLAVVPTFAGPADLRAAAVAATDEDFAVNYLDPSGWQEIPRKALIPRNNFALAKLRGSLGWLLDREGVELSLTRSGRAVA